MVKTDSYKMENEEYS